MSISDTLRLHILLYPDARDALHKQGFLAGDRFRICDESFQAPYEWMAARMAERLPSPSGVDPWPLWAWSRWRGQEAPDPMAEEYEGQDLWLVGFDMPSSDVLLSDFSAWHHPLNGWYLPDLGGPDEGEAECERFDAELEAAGVKWLDRPYPAPLWTKVTESWNRVFDVSDRTPDVQATFWRMGIDQVVSEIPAGRLAARAMGFRA